jgi:hypothetical protein
MECSASNVGDSLVCALCVCVALLIVVLPVVSPDRGAVLAENLWPTLYALLMLLLLVY